MANAPSNRPAIDTINELLASAIQAPSNHNTQPWRFFVAADHIDLYADRTRALPVNDPEDRELTISCGCALMNLRVAAAHRGLATVVDDTPKSADEDLLATVSFQDAPATPAEARLHGAIAPRRTYRRRFAAREVQEQEVAALQQAARDEWAWLQTYSGVAQRHELAALVGEGDAIQWANPSWRRELAMWMHPRRSGDGLTVPGLLAPVAHMVVRRFDMGDGRAAKDAELAEESPLLAVLGTPGDGVLDWLRAGQALQRVLLTAHGMGLQASYLNQPIQVAELRPRLQDYLARDGLPQILLRLGHAADTLPATPRRALGDVID
ncbi:MAG: nitroreductase [Gammaproteobacteria bacterium]|nr:nitroreductase [Gammaproteobacteria bacterium]